MNTTKFKTLYFLVFIFPRFDRNLSYKKMRFVCALTFNVKIFKEFLQKLVYWNMNQIRQYLNVTMLLIFEMRKIVLFVCRLTFFVLLLLLKFFSFVIKKLFLFNRIFEEHLSIGDANTATLHELVEFTIADVNHIVRGFFEPSGWQCGCCLDGTMLRCAIICFQCWWWQWWWCRRWWHRWCHWSMNARWMLLNIIQIGNGTCTLQPWLLIHILHITTASFGNTTIPWRCFFGVLIAMLALHMICQMINKNIEVNDKQIRNSFQWTKKMTFACERKHLSLIVCMGQLATDTQKSDLIVTSIHAKLNKKISNEFSLQIRNLYCVCTWNTYRPCLTLAFDLDNIGRKPFLYHVDWRAMVVAVAADAVALFPCDHDWLRPIHQIVDFQ